MERAAVLFLYQVAHGFTTGTRALTPKRTQMTMLSTTYDPHLAVPPRPPLIPTDPAAALAFTRYADRRADLLLAQGRRVEAERCAHAAFEARARARGGRA
jgi:hypothetical protein